MSSLPASPDAATPYKRWLCSVCGVIYDESTGWPEEGLAPGTRWEDVPPLWTCPDCGAIKDDFDMIDITDTGARA